MQRSRRGKARSNGKSITKGGHNTKSSAKSKSGGANSAQQIVNINMGEMMHKKRKMEEVVEPPIPISMPPKKPKQAPMPDTTKLRQELRKAITLYQRALDNLSPALHTPDIADVPDNLLTPTSASDIQQTTNWLTNATRLAQQRMNSTILRPNQMQPGAQSFIPLDEQLKMSRLQTALTESEKRVGELSQGRKLPGPPGSGTGGTLTRGTLTRTTENESQAPTGKIYTEEEIRKIDNQITMLKRQKVVAGELTKQNYEEIATLDSDLRQARALNPDNKDIVELYQELKELEKALVEISQAAAQAEASGMDPSMQIYLSPEPSPVTNNILLQQFLDKIEKFKSESAFDIMNTTNDAQLNDWSRAVDQKESSFTTQLQRISQKNEFSAQATEQVAGEINKMRDQLDAAIKAQRVPDDDLTVGAGRADAPGGVRSARILKRNMLELADKLSRANTDFKNATSDNERYRLWLSIRQYRDKLNEMRGTQTWVDLPERQTILTDRISPAMEGLYQDQTTIKVGDFVLILPKDGDTFDFANTVGRVTEWVGPDDGQTAHVQIGQNTRPSVIPVQRLYPAITPEITPQPTSDPSVYTGNAMSGSDLFGSPSTPATRLQDPFAAVQDFSPVQGSQLYNPTAPLQPSSGDRGPRQTDPNVNWQGGVGYVTPPKGKRPN